MRNPNNRRNAFFVLTVLGGIFVWRNRFTIQRRLESFGIRTPLLEGSLEEVARSITSKARGKMERGATLAENVINKKVA